jgi:hypothetical protein
LSAASFHNNQHDASLALSSREGGSRHRHGPLSAAARSPTRSATRGMASDRGLFIMCDYIHRVVAVQLFRAVCLLLAGARTRARGGYAHGGGCVGRAGSSLCKQQPVKWLRRRQGRRRAQHAHADHGTRTPSSPYRVTDGEYNRAAHICETLARAHFQCI